VAQVSADAAAEGAPAASPGAAGAPRAPGEALAYRTLVNLDRQALVADGVTHRLAPGMQVTAEIHLGTRTVLEYLLSPVQKAWHEAGRER
jgi:HlyD family secretion protein